MNARWGLFAAALLSSACGAVFPEIAPPIKSPPAGREMSPPPDNLLFIAFTRAEIPPKTRDGRQWDSLGGSLPDPFAKVFVDDREIVRTPIQANTLEPTWPDQKLANYHVPRDARVRVELWDSNPLNNHPICLQVIHDFTEQVAAQSVDVDCDSGARVRLRVERAHARWGLGFFYELRTTSVAVTRVLPESPAARAGLKGGEEILEIQGKKVSKMESGEPQSLVNSNAQIGVELLLRGADGKDRRVTVKEGAVYPAVEDGIPVD